MSSREQLAERCGNTVHTTAGYLTGEEPCRCRRARGHDGSCAFHGDDYLAEHERELLSRIEALDSVEDYGGRLVRQIDVLGVFDD